MDLNQILLDLVAKFPYISTVIMAVGFLRVINKPLFSLLHAYVAYTSTDADDKALDEVEQSSVYKGLLYVLDWFGSVKVGDQK